MAGWSRADRGTLLFLFGCSIACSTAPVPPSLAHRGRPVAPSCRFDDVPRLAVVSAMADELALLLQNTEVERCLELNGREVVLGRLAGNEVALMLSGVSMVNAAMSTQQLLDRFDIVGIVFSGVAGGVNPNLHVGDVTVPAEWGQHQESVFARAKGDGWDTQGRAGEFGNFGMMFPRGQLIAREGEAIDSPSRRFWFPADDEMLEVARGVAASVSLSRCTSAGECLDREPAVIVGGRGLSGPTFLDNTAYREWLWRTFAPDAVDMESAAVAHVGHVNQVPWIVFRSLSDLAGGETDANGIRVFGGLAANNSATVLLQFLGRWAARGSR